jgi:uncharacterized membrane protein YsdA (DUF1294 family)
MWPTELRANVLPILFAYALVSLATLVAFGFDKFAARRGRRRVPEKTLHLLALLGGWPGALIAMPLVNHKRRKMSFWRSSG